MRQQFVSLESVHSIRVQHSTLIQLILLWLPCPYNTHTHNTESRVSMCTVPRGLVIRQIILQMLRCSWRKQVALKSIIWDYKNVLWNKGCFIRGVCFWMCMQQRRIQTERRQMMIMGMWNVCVCMNLCIGCVLPAGSRTLWPIYCQCWCPPPVLSPGRPYTRGPSWPEQTMPSPTPGHTKHIVHVSLTCFIDTCLNIQIQNRLCVCLVHYLSFLNDVGKLSTPHEAVLRRYEKEAVTTI